MFITVTWPVCDKVGVVYFCNETFLRTVFKFVICTHRFNTCLLHSQSLPGCDTHVFHVFRSETTFQGVVLGRSVASDVLMNTTSQMLHLHDGFLPSAIKYKSSQSQILMSPANAAGSMLEQ